MEFIGKRRIPAGTVILFIIGILLSLIALDDEPSVVPFAIGFFCAGLTYFLTQTPPIRIDFASNTSFSATLIFPLIFPPTIAFFASTSPSISPLTPIVSVFLQISFPLTLPSTRTLLLARIVPSTTVPAPKKFNSVEDVSTPSVGLDSVLIRVSACGICGSDLSRFQEAGVYSYPRICGHEFAGIVEKAGQKVNHVTEGQLASVIPLIPCESCPACRARASSRSG